MESSNVRQAAVFAMRYPRMLICGSLITLTFLGYSCKSTRFPPTNAEQRMHKQKEDAEYHPPKEKDFDRDSGLGGGHK